MAVGRTKERWKYRRQKAQVSTEKMFHWLVALEGKRLEIRVPKVKPKYRDLYIVVMFQINL